MPLLKNLIPSRAELQTESVGLANEQQYTDPNLARRSHNVTTPKNNSVQLQQLGGSQGPIEKT